MPNKPIWNEGQLDAITTRGRGVVVSAAAGSGKTAVLVERTIRQLADEEAKIPADSLLAVTFTNAAAAQLRDKLTNALSEKVRENPESEWLARQQGLLQMAKIMTINAFSLEFVRNNCHILGLPSSIGILEENDVKCIEDECCDRVIDEFYENEPDKMRDLMTRLCERDYQIKDNILKLYRFLRSIPFSDRYISQSIERLKSEDGLNEYLGIITEGAIDALDRCNVILGKALALCDRLYIKHNIDENISYDIKIVGLTKAALESGDWNKAVSILISYKMASNKKKVSDRDSKKYDSDEQISGDNVILPIIAKYRDEYKELFSQSVSEKICTPRSGLLEEHKLSAEIIEFMRTLTNRLGGLVTAEKLRRGGVDFADVELFTVELLCRSEDGKLVRTELCEEIVASKQYGAILIDEYQDTNNLQDLIFKCISDTDDISVQGKNMFIVGDVKQAIYGFRQSNPRLFISARRQANLPENADRIREIMLEKNYRSRREIIDFTNFIFGKLMNEKIGEVEYSGGELLSYGAPYDDSKMPTNFLIYDGEEHISVAKKIRKMLDDGVMVDDKGSYRPCVPSDFCILSRGKSQNFLYAGAFEAVGLNISCSEIKGYLKAREVALIVNLLKVIDNPMNDMAMLSVLLSPVFMFTDDDVALLKASSEYKNKLYQLILEASKGEHEISDEIREKCGNAAQKIKLYRYFSSTMTIEQLIRRLYSETDFYILSCTFSSASQSQANLRLLVEFASAYDSNSAGGLTGFLRYFDNVLSSDNDFSQASVVTEEKNAVNVMTMHKSKGLEFPFVFLCNLKKKFREDSSERLLLDTDHGIGIRLRDTENLAEYPTAAHTAISDRLHYSSLSEELRLLYVAITRAREQLFITVPHDIKNAANVKTSAILSNASAAQSLSVSCIAMANCMLDWILSAMAFHKDGKKLLELLEIEHGITADDGDCDIAIENAPVGDYLPKKKGTSGATSDPEQVRELTELLSKEYTQPKNGFAKLSVSEVVHGDDGRTLFFPQIPKLSHELDSFSAAKRGTLTHRFMELCNFTKAKESPEDELKRLISLGHFTEAESLGLYMEAIGKFFSGSFAERMLKSKEIIREKQFMVKLSDLNLSDKLFGDMADSDGMLQGIADCLFIENDGYILLDYKTDRVENLDELVSRYSMQLLLYKAALDLILDAPIKSCIIYSFYLSDGIDIKLN